MFEMDVVESTDDTLYLDFHYCPLVKAWQKGATYPEIKARVLEQTGLKVSSLYISQVKQKCGLEVRENYHKAKSEKRKCKAASVSEGERRCNCGGSAAFSDDLIYRLPVWFSGGYFFLAKYSHSAKSVVQ